jgi:hypothetical protein
VQLATRQQRLQHVAGVHGAFGCAGAHHGVHFVYKQQHFASRVGDFFQYGFQALFELAAVFGARDQSAHIELDQALALKALRHVALDDTLRQAFDDGSLADPRLANQGGVVLGAARDDLHHAADLLVAADDRVELAGAGLGGQVAPVFFKRLVSSFRSLGGDALTTAHLNQGFQNGVAVQAIFTQTLALWTLRQAQQQVLGGDVFILHAFGETLGALQSIGGRTRQANLAGRAVDARARFELLADLITQGEDAARHLGYYSRDDALLLVEQRQQQVRQLYRLVVEILRQALRGEDRLL